MGGFEFSQLDWIPDIPGIDKLPNYVDLAKKSGWKEQKDAILYGGNMWKVLLIINIS